jgi:hypothetical protein
MCFALAEKPNQRKSAEFRMMFSQYPYGPLGVFRRLFDTAKQTWCNVLRSLWPQYAGNSFNPPVPALKSSGREHSLDMNT